MSSTLTNIMSLAKSNLARPRLMVFDCQRGTFTELLRFPARLDNSDNADWKALSLAPDEGGCTIEALDNAYVITPEINSLVRVNGAQLENACEIPSEGISLLQIGRDLIALAPGTEGDELQTHAQSETWRLFRLEDGLAVGTSRFSELPDFVRQRGLDPVAYGAAPLGLDSGFFLTQVYEALGVGLQGEEGEKPFQLDGSVGRYTCPLCWLKFEAGDAMNIAAHESLRGDPVLGEDARLRFFPTRFNDLGQAIDPMGMPSADLACPHCRRKLPPGFLEVPQFIFSLVGAPSAGKTYYLAVLLKILQRVLYREFGLVLKDGDPTGNMLLNQMKNRLFSAMRPEEAVLAKTALEGAMYDRFPRMGKMTALPRPFVYALGRARTEEIGSARLEGEMQAVKDGSDHAVECSMIFYDNAGEHFEPGVDLDDSPGALHVASSAAIFFLFDPTSNYGFRKLLSGSADPQLAMSGRLDQQDSIMAEMEIRVKRLLALDPKQKIDTPLVVLIGKCDVWKHLVKLDNFPQPLRNGRIDHAVVDANSAKLRDFLTQVDPAIVAHAEGLARVVRYFAVSAFGHSPVRIVSGESAGLIAPDPDKIDPIQIEVPTLWALSRLVPHLIPPA